MSHFIYFFTCFLFSANLFGQSIFDACDYAPPKEANNWQFYYRSGISFNSNPPQVFYSNNGLLLGKGVAAISDNEGSFLFYTNGEKVWNRNFEMMAGGTFLFGNKFCSQSSVIIQHPIHEVLYYLFTVDFPYTGDPQSGRGFRFSLIDMRLNGGLGDVSNPNVHLLDETAEKVTAVDHANGRDVWVVTHGWGGDDADAFYSFLVNKDGVSLDPIVSRIGTRHEGLLSDNNTAGYMKASPDGSKLALAVFGIGVIEVFDFDNATGELSNAKSSNDLNFTYGVEFSPDVSKLYVSTSPFPDVIPPKSYIFQFDLNSSDLFQNYDTIATSQDSIFAALQLGTDGKIYAARFISIQAGKNKMGVIENPNRPGDDCNFKELGFDMGTNDVRLGLPNFLTNYLDIPHFTYLHHCFGDSTAFKITNNENITTQAWNFVDPASGNNNTSTLLSPSHVFTEPGTFNVSVTEHFGGGNFTNFEEVIIYPLPVPDLGADTIYLYLGASFTLDAGPGYDYYFWNFDDYPSGQTFIASDTGLYHVMVVDTNCCYNMDSVLILPSVVYLPNAFTPNGDGINDKFIAIGPTGGILNYNIFIFNRWGQLVFKSDDIQNQWDGTINNEPAPPGVYVYKMTYSVELDFGKLDDVVLRGHVTLLR